MKFSNYKEAITHIESHGIPESILFDDNVGFNLAQWIVMSDINDDFKIPKNFKYEINISNDKDKKSIEEFLTSYLRYSFDISKGSTKKVIFNANDFSFDLFYSAGRNTELLMDDIIYRYLLYPTFQNIKKLITLYGKENVMRVLNNIRNTDTENVYKEIMHVSNPLLNE